ncbi:MAG: cell division protein FtsA [Bacteroidales bacterium]|jgi:cell division protein FtsA|nr:cell division protein FtsA [Bacteroidales bacterium]
MDNKSEIIAAIDIGTTKIVALAGRKTENNRFEILGFGTTSSKGIKRGVVLNIDETVKSIRIALDKVYQSSGIRLNEVFVGIAGQHVRSTKSRSTIKVSSPDSIISQKDIKDLEDLMRQIISEAGEEVLDVIPQSYIVDKETGIENPVGMYGNILQGNYHIILGQMSMVNNIKKCVTISGLKVKTLILEPLASSEAVLSDLEKKSGVVMMDIGGGTTDLAIYKDNKVIHTAVIPIGGNTITNDIQQELGILEKQAEELKINFGSAIQEKSQESTIFSIEGLKGREEKEITLKDLSAIIQARMEEILHTVMFQIESAGIKGNIPGGIVITGGGSLLKNLKQLASFITNNDIRIAYPTEYIEGKFSGDINKPQYSTAIGLIMKGYMYNSQKTEYSIFEKLNEEQKKEPEIIEEEKSKQHKEKENHGNKKFFNIIKKSVNKLLEDEEE